MDTELIEEFQKQLQDSRRIALLQAYVKEPNASAIATKALDLLTGC